MSLLDISGPFLSVKTLTETDGFKQGLSRPDENAQLRRELVNYYEQWLANAQSRRPDPAYNFAWFKMVILDVLEWGELALEGQAIPPGLSFNHAESGETIAPDLVFREAHDKPVRMLVQRYAPGQALNKPVVGSRWAESPSNRMAELLKRTGVALGIVTNGETWQLVNKHKDNPTGLAAWQAGLWFEEPVTFDAFRALLGIERMIGVPEDETLEALLQKSSEEQTSVSVRLGDQVRQAIELLVAGIDKEDATRNGALLAGIPDATVYESAITVMMRVIFLLFAEDQRPPLFGDNDGIYDRNYSVSGLIQELEAIEQSSGQEILEQKRDAWSRLLATFRLVHSGSDHDHMRQPAYGGSLFDPDRFPFLEGREPGSKWLDETAKPLPLNNRTVLHMLQAVQYLELKGLGERQRISFRALDIEQIGHVYEQLLEHTATRSDSPVLGITGTTKKGVLDEPEIQLDRLEEWRARGDAELLKQLKEQTGRSESALKKTLAAELDLFQENRLRTDCGTDALYQRVLPFAGFLRLDRAGHYMVIQPNGLYVTRGNDRRTTGAHYTPRSLTEPIVQYALEPLVYEGPAEGKPREEWNLIPPAALLKLTICDPAMGSGGFLVQACRYMSERLVEAWEAVGIEGEVRIAPDGSLSRGESSEEVLPFDRGERLAIARRLVADHCLYGVDVNPLAVDMAKLSLWLVTLQKDRPFTFLDHRLRCGDSLLGIVNIDQLRYFDLKGKPAGNKVMFSAVIDRYLRYAVEERQKIDQTPGLDANQNREKERRFQNLQQTMSGLRLAADLLTGVALTEKTRRDLRRSGAYQDAVLLTQMLPDAYGSEFRNSWVQSNLVEFEGKSEPYLLGNRPFHWPIEFPEVFLDSTHNLAREGFSGLIGNPPFLGGKIISTRLGAPYAEAIQADNEHARGTADIAAHFFVRGSKIASSRGSVGLIGPTTIAAGDTRPAGLGYLVDNGCTIYRAIPFLSWPGTSNVSVSVVHFTRRNWNGERMLKSSPVQRISSYLAEEQSISEGFQLKLNKGKISDGTKIYGEGFVLTPEERLLMLSCDQANSQVIFPYMNGDDLNSRPDLSAGRYVINFGTMNLYEAQHFDAPFTRVLETVKPVRDKLTGQVHETAFWRFWDKREALYRTIKDHARVLVMCGTTKYVALAFVENGRIYDQKLKVFTFQDYGHFAVLQSSIHDIWARHFSPPRGDVVSYSGNRAFLTFPFPPDASNGELQEVGRQYHQHRSCVALERNIGLTDIYNLFHDSADTSSDITELRRLQVELDNQVLASYGLDEPELDHVFLETKLGQRFTFCDSARRNLLNKLLELNVKLHEAEEDKNAPDSRSGAFAVRMKQPQLI